MSKVLSKRFSTPHNAEKALPKILRAASPTLHPEGDEGLKFTM